LPSLVRISDTLTSICDLIIEHRLEGRVNRDFFAFANIQAECELVGPACGIF